MLLDTFTDLRPASPVSKPVGATIAHAVQWAEPYGHPDKVVTLVVDDATRSLETYFVFSHNNPQVSQGSLTQEGEDIAKLEALSAPPDGTDAGEIPSLLAVKGARLLLKMFHANGKHPTRILSDGENGFSFYIFGPVMAAAGRHVRYASLTVDRDGDVIQVLGDRLSGDRRVTTVLGDIRSLLAAVRDIARFTTG